MISRWLLVKNTSKLVRLKALGLYFAFLQLTSIHEQFSSIYDFMKIIPKISVFCALSQKSRYFNTPQMLVKCSHMLVTCKFIKHTSRAFKRTTSEVFWTKTHWDIHFLKWFTFSSLNHHLASWDLAWFDIITQIWENRTK